MLKLGLVQMLVNEGEISKNKNHIEQIVSNNKNKSDLLCFPELCISGYNFDIARKSLDEEEFFKEISKKYQQPIMAGICTYYGGKYYDSLGIWDEKGDRLGLYKKIHLWDKENDFFSKGSDFVIVDFKGWKLGLLICADYGFPEVSRKLTLMGADILFYPSAWYGLDLLELCGAMRAAENQLYTVTINRASFGGKFCGGTAIHDPYGKCIKEILHEGEDYIEININKDRIYEVRKNELPWLSMRRDDIY